MCVFLRDIIMPREKDKYYLDIIRYDIFLMGIKRL